MSSEPGTLEDDVESPASLGSHRLSVQISPGDVAIGSSPVDSVTWDDLTHEWRSYLREKLHERLVFLDQREDEILATEYSHRFTTEYSDMTYARIKDFERGMFDEYDNPTLVFLTFTTSTTTDAGKPRCPFDVLDELLESWSSGVRYELSKTMKAERKKDTYPGFDSGAKGEPGEFEYLRILEPTTENGYGPSGYPHQHVILAVDGDVQRERFESVINKHLEKAPNALGRAHEFDTAIEVMDGEELTNVGAYIFKYLGKTYETGDLEEYEERFNALLWESGRRRIQPSDGAQAWMDRDEESAEEGRYQFVGVGDEEKVRELREYDSVREFRLDKEMGVRAFLSGRDSVAVDVESEGIQKDGVDGDVFLPPFACSPESHTLVREDDEQRRCLECGIGEETLAGWGHFETGEPPP